MLYQRLERVEYEETPGIDFDQANPKSVSLTKQSFKKDADINTVMDRYKKTGLLIDPGIHTNRQPFFGDFTGSGDYLSVQNRIAAVQSQFDTLPATTRDQFHNNAAELLDFLADPANGQKAIELKLKPAPSAPEVPPVIPAAPPV